MNTLFFLAEDVSTTSIEDLLVTFIHRPLKTEPLSYDDNIFDNPPQLDGHVDSLSTESSSKSNQNDAQKRLEAAIAKISAKHPKPNKTIQLHQIPIQKSKFRLNDDLKKKPNNRTPKKSFSISSKLDRIKEQTIKESKQIKKIKPRLLNSLLKTNEDVIRPLHTPIPKTPTNNQVDIN